MFERGRALTSTIGVGSYHLDRIRMKLPRTSVQGFERPGRSLYGLRRAFRITDVNSLLQALEWVAVRAEQSLEEANVVCGHNTPPYLPPTYSQYRERLGRILMWVKKAEGARSN
jgi:ABC-type branched-subunit amino acid transport system ATPase component